MKNDEWIHLERRISLLSRHPSVHSLKRLAAIFRNLPSRAIIAARLRRKSKFWRGCLDFILDPHSWLRPECEALHLLRKTFSVHLVFYKSPSALCVSSGSLTMIVFQRVTRGEETRFGFRVLRCMDTIKQFSTVI